jgi:hypothetical protein
LARFNLPIFTYKTFWTNRNLLKSNPLDPNKESQEIDAYCLPDTLDGEENNQSGETYS